MDQRFQRIIDFTISFEVGSAANGGWVNDPSDPGGATQWGISARFNPSVATLIQSGKLTRDQAERIYWTKYYRPIYKVNDLPIEFAFMIFDAKVHGSLKPLVRDMQSTLNMLTSNTLVVDGLYGPKTFYAINSLSEVGRRDLLSTLKRMAPHRAKKVARATMITQSKRGLPSKDYTRGFTNRFVHRAEAAEELVV